MYTPPIIIKRTIYPPQKTRPKINRLLLHHLIPPRTQHDLTSHTIPAKRPLHVRLNRIILPSQRNIPKLKSKRNMWQLGEAITRHFAPATRIATISARETHHCPTNYWGQNGPGESIRMQAGCVSW